MSKLLKLIVNVFLVAAILIAVAILVPPLAGVKTTIVDTTAMKTNLPLGSVTYSNDIDVFDIKPGDVILKENDSSTYAYVIIETDAANGKFKAISAADPNGPEEEVILRFRDDCGAFDPVNYIPREGKDALGIRLVMAVAQDAQYTHSLNLNNLMLKVPIE